MSTNNRILCFGEILLRLTTPNGAPLMASPTFDWHIGGAEANVAVGLAHLGHPVRIASILPDNPLGDAAARELRRHGVDLSEMGRAPGRMGLYFFSKGSGRRPGDITYDRQSSAFATAAPDRYDFDRLVSETDWVHVSGVTPAIGANAAEATCLLVEAAARASVPVSFDFNHREKMWQAWGGDPSSYLHRIVSSATMLFANDHDLARVIDLEGETVGRTLNFTDRAFDAFDRLQCVTSAFRTVHAVERQSLRAELVTRAGRAETDTLDMENIVDRIGGGDAYAAAAIHEYMKGSDADMIVRSSLAASVLKHTVSGDFPIASETDIADFLAPGVSDVRR